MSFQKTLWAGIAIGLGVAVLAGVVGLFATGTVPTPDIARLLATATHTPTLTPAPTPTLSAAAICRAATTTWVRGMNEIVLMMLDIDDAKPTESGQTLSLVQQRFSDLRVPDCADSQLRSIDTSMRAALRSAIAWTDAELEEDLFAAQEAEAKAEALFVVDDYRAYLETNAYSNELLQFRTQSNSVATKTAGYPTRTPVSALSLYRACVKAVFSFHADIDILRDSARSHLDTLETYARGGRVEGIDPDMMTRFGKTIDDTVAPSCIDEPQEIKYYLALTADNLKLGFIEIKVETDNGRPDAQSRRRVQKWIDEIRSYQKKVDAGYKTMPGALAQMLSPGDYLTPTPAPNAIDETLDDLPLKDYALNKSDFSNAVILEESRYYTNNEHAKKFTDSETVLANFNRIGLIDTYQAAFIRPNSVPAMTFGTDYMIVRMTRTNNAQQASELFDFLIPADKSFQRTNVQLTNVDEVVSLLQTEDCVDDGKYYTCTNVRIYFRKGNIIGNLRTSSYTTFGDMTLITKYAQIIAERMNQ